ncbi:hypothetical protein CLCR_01732 [Cladophialophora carrionii]|uniref:Uncharacterized protein n=1 Tax=Cladophialophora carrionii TaxID=86049 RepID=A0A1C1CBF2_9EURO|nr:hypothetical protein CLCR_01732 [Cladophialophora carrionii]
MPQAGYTITESAGRPRTWPRPQLNHELLFKNNYGSVAALSKTRTLELEHLFATESRRLEPTKAILPKLNFPHEPSLAQEVNSQLTSGSTRGESSISKKPAETTMSGTTETTEASSSRTKASSEPSSGTNPTEGSMSEARRPKIIMVRHCAPDKGWAFHRLADGKTTWTDTEKRE